jgi:hypothetical protein
MPVPKPNSGESEQEFVSRCMHEIGNEYDQQQALAICYNMFTSAKAEGQAQVQEAIKKAEEQVKDFLKK